MDKILDKFSNDDSGVARTLIDVNLHMSKIEEKVYLSWSILG